MRYSFMTAYYSLKKIITFHIISSDKGKEREGMEGEREERGQNLFRVHICIHLD